MEDEAILLKIKRDFTTNEAVQSLLKIVSSLETEIGVLKSELAEAQDKVQKIREERTMTKKQWMKDEVFALMNQDFEVLRKKVTEYKKSSEEWRNKYFSISSTINK